MYNVIKRDGKNVSLDLIEINYKLTGFKKKIIISFGFGM